MTDVRPGEIQIEDASRRFRVYAAARAHAQGGARRAHARARLGRRRALGRLVLGRAGRGRRPDRPERLGQDDPSPPDRRDHEADRRAGSRSVGASGQPARARRRLPPGVHGARERLSERLDSWPQADCDPTGTWRRSSRSRSSSGSSTCPCERTHRAWYMRLGFAVAAHLEVDVLLLDEVFAVGDEEFQRKCFGKIFEFKQRGGTIVFVSHDAAAVERLCGRAVLLREGEVDFDGPTREAVTRYHRLLADERDPDERGAGLSEYGSGECGSRRSSSGSDDEQRLQFAPGETSLSAHVAISADPGRAPPRLSWELHDEAGLVLASGAVATDEIGWLPGKAEQRFALRHRQPAACRRPLSIALRALGRRRAAPLPLGRRRGPLRRLSGGRRCRTRSPRRTWSLDERRRATTRRAMSYRTCPDWPELMEIAPDLQFKHYTVREAQLPGECARLAGPRHVGDGVDLLRPRATRLLRRSHRSAGRRRAEGVALVRPDGVDDDGPGTGGSAL